jgi:hypothetical protein
MDEQQAVGPVRVVYESEPRDHGVAARALPSISTDFLRGVFANLLLTSDDLNAFALDYFSSVHRQFSSGMTREAREDLLLARACRRGPSMKRCGRRCGSKVPPPPSQADTRATLPNPYRGLLVFGVKDAPLFFGRAKKTAELRRLFDAAVQPPPDAGPVPPRLVAVIGPSGSGKSSLAQAGLLADLLRKPPIGVSYVAAVLRPQGRPLRALARVLAKLKQPTTEWPLGQIDSIVERLRSGPGALGDLVSDVLTEPEQRLLLVVDQLEELYSMAEESEAGTVERRAFVAAVLGAASERRGRLDVVVTLRADLLGEVGADPQLQTALTTTGRALLVGALDAEELAEAVAGPAARTGRPLPPDAVALLVREAEGQAGALPLLQFTLEKLWKAIDDAPTTTDCGAARASWVASAVRWRTRPSRCIADSIPRGRSLRIPRAVTERGAGTSAADVFAAAPDQRGASAGTTAADARGSGRGWRDAGRCSGGAGSVCGVAAAGARRRRGRGDGRDRA